MHEAIETRCVERGQTLHEGADEIGVTPVALQRLLERGKAPMGGMPTVMRMTLWLERPALDFFVWTLPLS